MKSNIPDFDFYRIKKIFEKVDFSVGREQTVWKRILQKKEDMPNQSREECLPDEELQSVAGGKRDGATVSQSVPPLK